MMDGVKMQIPDASHTEASYFVSTGTAQTACLAEAASATEVAEHQASRASNVEASHFVSTCFAETSELTKAPKVADNFGRDQAARTAHAEASYFVSAGIAKIAFITYTAGSPRVSVG